MSRRKIYVQGESMRARAYPILCEAIENGVSYGWMRAHKHNETPTEEAIKEAITNAVLNEICEWFEFPELERAN